MECGLQQVLLKIKFVELNYGVMYGSMRVKKLQHLTMQQLGHCYRSQSFNCNFTNLFHNVSVKLETNLWNSTTLNIKIDKKGNQLVLDFWY